MSTPDKFVIKVQSLKDGEEIGSVTATVASEASCRAVQEIVFSLGLERLQGRALGRSEATCRPERGTDIEAWIKRTRDRHIEDLDPEGAEALDRLLDNYRERADLGSDFSEQT